MNKSTYFVIAAGMSVASLATADPLLGLEVVSLGNTGNGVTLHVYANVEAGARIDAVFGNSQSIMSISAAEGMSFYQNVYGGNTSAQCNEAFFALAPSLQFDTFGTIGALDSTGNPFPGNALNDIGNLFDTQTSSVFANGDNGSWFVTPEDAQGGEVGGQVLIGQFTIVGGTGEASDFATFNVGIQGKDANGVTFQNLNVQIPAPGALALLGVAGLAARRRRR